MNKNITEVLVRGNLKHLILNVCWKSTFSLSLFCCIILAIIMYNKIIHIKIWTIIPIVNPTYWDWEIEIKPTVIREMFWYITGMILKICINAKMKRIVAVVVFILNQNNLIPSFLSLLIIIHLWVLFENIILYF